MIKFHSLEPFVPAGKDMEASKQFFQELGFAVNWDEGDYVGFEKDGCKFILQNFYQKDFAENFMVSVRINDAEAFRQMVLDKNLPEKYGISIGEVLNQPYGKEVNIIDIAGVCWHFVE